MAHSLEFEHSGMEVQSENPSLSYTDEPSEGETVHICILSNFLL